MKSTTETLRIKNSWNMSWVHKIGQTESCTNCKEHFYPSESFIYVYDQYLREMIYANPNKRKLKLKNNWFLDLVFWIAKCKNSSKSCPIFFNQNSPSYLAQSWILILWLQWYVINCDIHQCIASIFSISLDDVDFLTKKLLILGSARINSTFKRTLSITANFVMSLG